MDKMVKTLKELLEYFNATHYDCEGGYIILYDDDYMTIAEIFEDEFIDNIDIKSVFRDIENQ